MPKSRYSASRVTSACGSNDVLVTARKLVWTRQPRPTPATVALPEAQLLPSGIAAPPVWSRWRRRARIRRSGCRRHRRWLDARKQPEPKNRRQARRLPAPLPGTRTASVRADSRNRGLDSARQAKTERDAGGPLRRRKGRSQESAANVKCLTNCSCLLWPLQVISIPPILIPAFIGSIPTSPAISP